VLKNSPTASSLTITLLWLRPRNCPRT